MSFGGGGSDLTHYFETSSGAVLNSALIYSHATMRVRDDSKINITSSDLKKTLSAKDLNEALLDKGSFGLIQLCCRLFNLSGFVYF